MLCRSARNPAKAFLLAAPSCGGQPGLRVGRVRFPPACRLQSFMAETEAVAIGSTALCGCF